MKKRYFLIVLSFLIFNSCDKETIDEPFSSNDLVGTWNVKEFYTENATFSTSVSGIPVSGNATATGKDFDASLTFTDTPNVVNSTGSFTLTVEFSIAGTTQSNDQLIDQLPNSNGTWTLENNVLTITEATTTTSFDVLSFDNDVLKLKSTLNETSDIAGTSITLEGDVYLTLEK